MVFETNFEDDCLTKSTFARLLPTEAKRIHHLHIAQTLISSYNTYYDTLLADVTSQSRKSDGTCEAVKREKLTR